MEGSPLALMGKFDEGSLENKYLIFVTINNQTT